MATEKVDGFRLDRVGKLLSTAYAELHVTPGLEELVLRPFAPGVLLHSDGRHHRAGVQPGSRRARSTMGARGALHAVRALASAPVRGRASRSRCPDGRCPCPATGAAPRWARRWTRRGSAPR